MNLPHIISIAALTPAQIEAMAREAFEHGLGFAACPFEDGPARKTWLAAYRALAGKELEAA